MPICTKNVLSHLCLGSDAAAYEKSNARTDKARQFEKSVGPTSIGGVLCSLPVRGASQKKGISLKKAFSFSTARTDSVKAQLGRSVLDRSSDILLSSLNGTSGRRVLDLSGASQLLRKHGQEKGDWALVPSCFWVAQQASGPAPRTAAQLVEFLQTHQLDIPENRCGAKAKLREWLGSQGLEMSSPASKSPQVLQAPQAPQANPVHAAPGNLAVAAMEPVLWSILKASQLTPAKPTLFEVLVKEVFRNDIEGYRVITLHGKDPDALKGAQPQHTIAIWPGSSEDDSPCRLFDPAFGEIEFSDKRQFAKWFERQFSVLSGYGSRYEDGFDISFVRQARADASPYLDCTYADTLLAPSNVVSDRLFDSLAKAGGNEVLKLSGVSHEFLMHASNNDLGLAPCRYWAASHPDSQHSGALPRANAAKWVEAFKASIGESKSPWKDWMSEQGLETRRTPTQLFGASTHDMRNRMLEEIFTSKVNEYKFFTLLDRNYLNANEPGTRHTIAALRERVGQQWFISLFDPAHGEIQFNNPNKFVAWFGDSFWPLSGYKDRYEHGWMTVNSVGAKGAQEDFE